MNTSLASRDRPTPCTLSYAEFHTEGRPFVLRHHYTHRCPSVQKQSYALRNPRGKVCAVAVYGPPPARGMAQALLGDEHAPLVTWQARLIGAGVSADDLDRLQDYARHDLSTRLGYKVIYTMTENQAYMVDGLVGRMGAALSVRAYAGWQYDRSGWLYLGTTTPSGTAGYAIDGQVHHARQGRRTLSPATVRLVHPGARAYRRLAATPKARWVDVLAATPEEHAWLISLLRYPPREFSPLVQHRLLTAYDHLTRHSKSLQRRSRTADDPYLHRAPHQHLGCA